MRLAEDPPASVFRVPIARVCSLVSGTAHYKRVFVLWVVQIGLETAFVQLEIRPLLTMETKVLTLGIDGIAAMRAT
jgi:hypothetical protein